MTSKDLIQSYYDAFNAKDWNSMIACVSPALRHDVNEGAERMGHDAFRQFLAHMDTCYDETLTDITVMTSDDGKRGAAEFIVNGIYKQTDGNLPPARGQTYKLPAGAFFEISDGKIARVTTYYNLAEWTRQVSS